MSKYINTKLVLCAVISTLFLSPMLLSAQVLEEIIVTAQRRNQTLQEVPISIEAFSGAELQKQGYRNLSDLANFSATVLVDEAGFLSTERTVRGFGSSGNALTVEQAVPIFIDGLHYGRPPQVKTAFMDLERVEVLKGPQPVFFGMSATAGAFNIQSARPTAEWEGYVDAEYANNAKSVFEAAIGGPITDTWGIRVATKYETTEGFMRDVVSGNKIGDYENLGARVIVQWAPTDNFTARFKLEGSGYEKFPEASHVCLTGGPLIYGRNDISRTGDEGRENAVFAPAPRGEDWSQAVDIDGNCYRSNKGISLGGPWYAPPLNIREEQSDTGAIDAREALAKFNELLWERSGGTYGSDVGNRGIDRTDSHTAYLDFTYALDNGIEVNSLTGFSHYKRLNARDNSSSPFLMNFQNRVEIYDQWSSELRFTSPSGGTIEWMLGLFWQKTDYDITSNSTRPNVRRGIRTNDIIWEDQEWKTAFASVTFNFLDDRAAIDLGGRYVDLGKTGAHYGLAGQWVFDSRPCESNSTGRAGGTEDDGGGDFSATCPTHSMGLAVDESQVDFLLPGADADNLWILDYQGSRATPPNWRSPRAHAIGALIYPNRTTNTLGGPRDGKGLRREPWTPLTTRADDGGDGVFDSTAFDPTVTVRYKLTDNHSVYARWAEAFKAGGFDTGVTTLNSDADGFGFLPETARTYELGSKGSLMDGRVRYDLGLFQTKFFDLQTTVATGIPDDPFLNTNAGIQQVQGFEFNFNMAVSDQLTASLAGAFMDGQFVDFIGGCTQQEERDIGTSTSECFYDEVADDFFVDRGGQETAKTPDWKFVLSLDYWMPLGDNFRLTSNFKGYMSDGYVTDVNSFTKTSKYDSHEDLNMTVGIGDSEETWEISAFVRNMLEARPTYHPDFDVAKNGYQTLSMSPSMFRSYGVNFRYNFR
jgi:outer membrane receptor protein involved in Fe transport